MTWHCLQAFFMALFLLGIGHSLLSLRAASLKTKFKSTWPKAMIKAMEEARR